MNERYEPKSDFLRAFIADEIPLTGSALAEANLRKLVSMTRDDDRSNRDWATMLLAQEAIDTSEVRTALLAAANDEDDVVRAEAMLGLAMRDKNLALPFVLRALLGDFACMAVFEAAELLADPALVEPLRSWTEPSENNFLDRLARNALIACESGER
ncbi:HEAT repeat domain-containing protein [Novosphingobium sp.]|uniref:HEAT repeat domain-containing protein n=1 Tax=Novosphingobium sp. TaxID=1874826 RepID=UPI00286E470B|nr:HEAT repeat domain-containing protein [Novosphingobium sp.]